MANSIIRDTVIIGCLAVGVALAAANKDELYNQFGLNIIPSPESAQSSTDNITDKQNLSTSARAQVLTGSAVSIPKSKSDGQFWADARVNNGVVNFLVDTGASAVALTPEDARRAGVRIDQLNYNVPISTAGGENVAAYVNLKSISIGNVTVRNVRALVVPDGLSTSLLGMTFLGELQKVEATPNALILRL